MGTSASTVHNGAARPLNDQPFNASSPGPCLVHPRGGGPYVNHSHILPSRSPLQNPGSSSDSSSPPEESDYILDSSLTDQFLSAEGALFYSEPEPPVQRSEEPEDGYRWRKYGSKTGRKASRCYYKCCHVGCTAKKITEVANNGQSTSHNVMYKESHNHDAPSVTRSVVQTQQGLRTSVLSTIAVRYSPE